MSRNDTKKSFREFTGQDYYKIKAMRDMAGCTLTATSEKSVFSWCKYYEFICYEKETYMVIYSKKLHRFLYPFGEVEKAMKWIEGLEWDDAEKGFCFLDREQAVSLARRGYQVREDRASGEYIYTVESLALTEGKGAPNFRRKCRRFAKQYSYTVRKIDDGWLRGYKEEGYQKKQAEVQWMLRHFREYEMSGLMISCKEEQAFIFGYENTKQIFTLTGVDYTPGFGADAVPACIHEMARCLCGKYKYIDLEEDMGMEGLRRMKMLYKPVFLLEAFYADYRNYTYRSGEGEIFLP